MNNENFASTEEYKKRRLDLENYFQQCEPLEDKREIYISPTGKYLLAVTPHFTKEGCWNYIKGEVFNKDTKEQIFTIYRNYSSWWHLWLEHQNGNEYLLCGEDYQGYVCLNITKKLKHVYFHENGFKGCGFCWTSVSEYSKDIDNTITVEGCYWGAPYEGVEYDFMEPDVVPYKEIRRWDIQYDDDADEEEAP